MWCVRTDDDGILRTASRLDEHGDHYVAFTLEQWEHMDPRAAEQFTAPAGQDAHLRLQLAFNAATGLDRSATIRAGMTDAWNTYGGTDGTTAHTTRA